MEEEINIRIDTVKLHVVEAEEKNDGILEAAGETVIGVRGKSSRWPGPIKREASRLATFLNTQMLIQVILF